MPDISTIKRASPRRRARYYAKMAKLGHQLGISGCRAADSGRLRRVCAATFDQFGELFAPGICRTTLSGTSMDVCDSGKVAHPAIVSEGGRAIVAHHSVLVVEAFSSHREDRAENSRSRRPKRSQTRPRYSRREATSQARESPREFARHPADQGGIASRRSISVCSSLESKAKIDAVYWQLAHSDCRACTAACRLRPG